MKVPTGPHVSRPAQRIVRLMLRLAERAIDGPWSPRASARVDRWIARLEDIEGGAG